MQNLRYFFGEKRKGNKNSNRRWNILTRARINRTWPAPLYLPFRKKRNYLLAREGGEKMKKKSYDTWRNETSVAGALVSTNDKETVGERCAHVRISSNSAEVSTPLSRMQIVCQEDRKNPESAYGDPRDFFGEFSHGGGSSSSSSFVPKTRPFN